MNVALAIQRFKIWFDPTNVILQKHNTVQLMNVEMACGNSSKHKVDKDFYKRRLVR